MSEFLLSIYLAPGAGFILGSLVVIGMLVGAIVKHAGWGLGDYALWLFVVLVFALGVQVLETQVPGYNMQVPGWKGLTLIGVALVFYQSGIILGAYIVKYQRGKTREALKDWKDVQNTVICGDRYRPRRNR